MRRSALIVMVLLLLLSGCSDSLLKPKEYDARIPKASEIDTSRLMDAEGNFNIGYQNYNIRPNSITLNWAKSTEADFLCYKIFLFNTYKTTIYDKAQTEYVFESLTEDTLYNIRLVTVLRSGCSSLDEISVKTPKNLAPHVNYRINYRNQVVFKWQDNSEIPGDFVFIRDGVEIARIPEQPHASPDYIYSFVDEGVANLESYSYSIHKEGEMDSSPAISGIVVQVRYTMNSPNLGPVIQLTDQRAIYLAFHDNSSGETGFRVYRRSQNDSDFTLIASVDGLSIMGYLDNDSRLQYGVHYDYYVTAIDNDRTPAFESPASNIEGILFSDPGKASGRGKE